MSHDFAVSVGPTNDIKTQILVEINSFLVLAKTDCIPLHDAKFPPKQLIRHEFLKDEVSKSNQRFSSN